MGQVGETGVGPEGHLKCYECGELTPMEGGPLCWVCRSKDKSLPAVGDSQTSSVSDSTSSKSGPKSTASAPLTVRERSLIQSAESLGAIAKGVAVALLALSLLAAVIFIIVAVTNPDATSVALAMGVLCAFSGVLYWVVFRLLALVGEYVAVRVSRFGNGNG